MVIKVSVDDNLYDEYKKMIKEKNQLIMGYNSRIFTDAVEKELKAFKESNDRNSEVN